LTSDVAGDDATDDEFCELGAFESGLVATL
jgi:hypothetical protein